GRCAGQGDPRADCRDRAAGRIALVPHAGQCRRHSARTGFLSANRLPARPAPSARETVEITLVRGPRRRYHERKEPAMIELTEQQMQALENPEVTPPRIVN